MKTGYLQRFVQWIDEAVKSNELFISDDIDWFFANPPKEEWPLLGFSLSALAKTMLVQKGVTCPVCLIIPLKPLSRPGKVPAAVTYNLLGKVDDLPTIYILKGEDKEGFIRKERDFFSRFVQIDPGPLSGQIEGPVFYCEQKYSDAGEYFCDRYLLFLF